MQEKGFTVLHSERSTLEVVTIIRANPRFDAIVFEHDTAPLPANIIPTVRQHCDSPLVLFGNPNLVKLYGTDHEDDAFDLIIPPLTHPAAWLSALRALITDHAASD